MKRRLGCLAESPQAYVAYGGRVLLIFWYVGPRCKKYNDPFV